MSDDLVDRLHDRRVCSPAQNSCRNDHVLNTAADRIEELEAKLAKAVDFIEDLTGCEWPYNEDAKRILAELKGKTDE